ncbi:MAG TPA: carotenoid biosynthesis protein [Blastocatellia bacterium]|nr:carotenoid biosynthesis protein [Blastocatellia bacterium]
MVHFLQLLAGTVILRPYVFVFLLAYLFFAITHMGWKRTALFTALAYLVAFICEWSSAVAGTGFPFGLYRYIDTTRDRELWIAGVPFMDSLSFTFLSYVSWELAATVLGKSTILTDTLTLERERTRRRWSVTLLAAFLMMYLDIIIDPVTLQGERWFLGKLYYYPNGGSYFGVTIANFIGWFFVCFVILRLFIALDLALFGDGRGSRIPVGVVDYPFKSLGPVALYFGILAFNLVMTFRIGERTMGWAGLFIALPLLLLVMMSLTRPLRER